MNRKNLTAAVLAGLAGVAGIAGTAQAVNMNPDGLGQVLLYPYYTANDGNQTILSVVNTTSNAKAVKVRFLEGFNSREVLDFNLYMSEYDVWVAAITVNDEGGGKLLIPDTSCTVPYLYAMGGEQDFLDLAFTGDFDDGGPQDIGRTAEGHFEMIEMGTLTGDAEVNVRHEPANDDGIRMPLDCMELTTWWTDFAGSSDDGIWYEEAVSNNDCEPYPDDLDDLEFAGCQAEEYTVRNSGGLFGAAAVVNANEGTMFSYDAKAIQGFDDTDDGIHFIPGTIFPSLNSGSINDSWVFFGVPQNDAVFLDYDETVDAVSSVFMHDTIMNEYYTGGMANAATEWVITFPTKNFYADWWRMCEVGLVPAIDCYGDADNEILPEDAYARAPFTYVFGEVDSDDNLLCEPVFLKTWDREEDTFNPTTPDNPIRPPVVSPSLPVCDPEEDPNCRPGEAPFQICNEVNVLRFGDNPIFGTPGFDEGSLLLSVEDEFDAGWGRLTFTGRNATSGLPEQNGINLLGLPVAGFAAYKLENGFVESDMGTVQAYYGGLFGHKGNVRATGGVTIQPTP